MLLNMDMVAGAFSDHVIRACPGGHEELLSLERWQMYDGEDELKSGILYLADTGMIADRVKGPSESGLILRGDPENCRGQLKCPHLFVDGEKISRVQLINEVSEAFRHFNEVEKRLLKALYEGESFQKLVDIFSPVMSNELILMNSDFRLVGQTYETNRLYEQNSFVQDMGKEYIPSEVLTFFKNDPVYANVRDEKEPFLYQASIHNVDIWCMNVFLNNKFICRVTMPESERKFRSYDKELLRYFTGIVQKKYNDLRADDTYQQNSRLNVMLLKLLEGENVDDSQIQRMMLGYMDDRINDLRCVYILPSDRDYYHKTLTAYCEYIEIHYKGAAAFEYENNIVCLFAFPKEKKAEEELFRTFMEFLRDNYLKAGFSNSFRNVKELHFYFRQAKYALETGLQHSPYKWMFSFQKECLHYMRTQVTSDLPPEYLCSPKLLEIIRYDEVNHTDYRKTLTMYLDTGRNAVETAKKLFIHRSTMMYRLKQLQEKFQIDFRDPDELLYLMISIRLLK